MFRISKIHGREILDSRGNPTVEAELYLEDGSLGIAAVPSGASTGIREAIELRDGDSNRYLGLGVTKAVNNINSKISGALHDKNISNQEELDQFLIDLDGSEDKSNLGANSLVSVSMAFAKACSNSSTRSLMVRKPDFKTCSIPFKINFMSSSE